MADAFLNTKFSQLSWNVEVHTCKVVWNLLSNNSFKRIHLQLFADEAILYAGAGVMGESDPEKEWRETELKMNTLERIIRK